MAGFKYEPHVLNEKISANNFDKAEKEFIELGKEYENKWKSYLKNYEKMNDIEPKIFSDFVSDTKYIFQLMHKLYANEDLLNDLNTDFNSNSIDDQEKNEINRHYEFIDNINIVINGDSQLFKDKDSNVNNAIVQCEVYIDEKNKSLNEFSDTMNEMNDMLEKLGDNLNLYINAIRDN